MAGWPAAKGLIIYTTTKLAVKATNKLQMVIMMMMMTTFIIIDSVSYMPLVSSVAHHQNKATSRRTNSSKHAAVTD